MFTANPVRWHFTRNVTVDRSTELLAWTAFDKILEDLLKATILAFDWESAYSANLHGCHRASFQLRVGKPLYDAFFNAPAGYRGQFATSETSGERANRQLLDAFEPSLLVFARGSTAVTQAQIVASLRARQAKVWIVETEVEDQLLADVPSIVYPPWEFNEPNGQGLRAPIGTLLEVKGGWLDATDNERLDPTKMHRSLKIHKTGDSK